MTTNIEDWKARRARYDAFAATELGKLFIAYRNAVQCYWQQDGNDSISNKRLNELANKERETEKALTDKLMEIANV